MILRGRRQRCRIVRRRANPSLAILNPLPPRLTRYAATLTAEERQEFLACLARYHRIHGNYDVQMKTVGTVPGAKGKRFLVGIGSTEDVSYSANRPGEYRGSQKRGVPFRHEFPSKPHMATNASGNMIMILNRKGSGKRFTIAAKDEWIRG